MTDVRSISFPHRRSADHDRWQPPHHAVVIVGAGPVGLVIALDLAAKGHRSIVIDKKANLAAGSRAICWAKRSLEIMDRLGLGDVLTRKGVTWQTGKVFFANRRLFEFDLLPESAHRRPAFVNLQQYYFEHFCIEAAARTGLVDLRWQEEVVGLQTTGEGTLLQIRTPAGDYRLIADWVIAADGAHSNIRRQLGLGFEGRVFDDQFLICDIKMRLERPAERWFWFDPPFNRGRSALLHKQADDVWRLDFQLGTSADRDEEIKPDKVARRVRAMLGTDIAFGFEWISFYRFQSRRLARFRHGRVLFAGDAAHQMSPFGARGGNSGIQDADNLAWKLDLVLRRLAPESLLDSYDCERIAAAEENLLNTTRSTDFIAPKGAISRAFRDGVLALAETEPLARRFVNSGRLSIAASYAASPLNGPDDFAAGECPLTRPGAAGLDAPVADAWLLPALGDGFVAVCFGRERAAAAELGRAKRRLAEGAIPIKILLVSDEIACRRYGAERAPAYYLFRPDQHVAARWRRLDLPALTGAAERACAWNAGRST
jgi:3-(3-hydroxy-phenyl)propionate hydroxylase